MILKDAITLFLGDKKPTTRRSYQDALWRMAGHVGERRPVASITPANLVEYFQREIKAPEKAYAAATVQKHVKTCKTFFNWCVNLELIERSPMRAVKAPTPPRRISRDKAMTDYELNRILDYAKWKPRDYALILWLADTAARAKGTSELTLDAIQWGERTATITEKGKTRPVQFGDITEKALRYWLDWRADRFTVTGPFMWTNDGSPISSEAVSQIVRRACLAAGVKSRGAHSLRHRKGHQLADGKVAPSISATALGHSDPAITMRYYYPSDWETAQHELKKLTMKKTPKVVPFRDDETG